MVLEGVVLRRIENLQKRRAWITAPVRAKLVDFVKKEQRIVGLGLFQALPRCFSLHSRPCFDSLVL
jgi:hypothetical protein